MVNEHLMELLKHKKVISAYLGVIMLDLLRRAVEHDDSKFSPEEFSTFEQATPKLKDLVYGSDKYKQVLKEIEAAVQHHYQVNRHHPEHFENGINGMNLVDLIEMVCDWVAASQRVKEGDIYKSLDINRDRFGISEQLLLVIKNTIDLLMASQDR